MNSDPFDRMIDQFEQGRIGRRQLAVKLAALAAAWAGAGRFAIASPPQDSEKGKSTFQAKGLNHLALRVTDVARSRDWYKKHLGLSVLRDGRQNCFMRTGSNFVALFRSRTAGMHHYCYTIADYDPATVVRTLKGAGLEPRREQNRVYFPDPDGLTVQLSADNDWKDW